MSERKHIPEATTTQRGFEVIHFDDSNCNKCSIQQSSAMDDTERGLNQPGSSFLWIGVDDPKPKILASIAQAHGIKTYEVNGWIPYPIPDEVLITKEMHLHREQVQELVGILTNWLDTGSLK